MSSTSSTQDQRKPADDEYNALCDWLRDLRVEAGAFLSRYLRENDPVSLRIAEDFAREASKVDDRMKAWRLANGYDA